MSPPEVGRHAVAQLGAVSGVSPLQSDTGEGEVAQGRFRRRRAVIARVEHLMCAADRVPPGALPDLWVQAFDGTAWGGKIRMWSG
jgi:hypothetical protein